jgi:hypothetical protein
MGEISSIAPSFWLGPWLYNVHTGVGGRGDMLDPVSGLVLYWGKVARSLSSSHLSSCARARPLGTIPASCCIWWRPQ